ncbi:hypothetical protein BDR26DRAFT_851803 [Obelidium mucronatum]|nr:hypothetical protein BDR26DRAFT_851803 [Obelidium mucronatum]
MYEGYPPHFSGHTMPQQQLSSNHHDPSLLQYNDAETNPQFKPEIFDPTSFNQSSNSFDHDPRKEKHYFKTNDNLIPPSATPPSEPIDHESFDSTPSGGMGGFVSNWGYENNSTGSIPLSMMHSPLRNTSSSFGLPLPITSDSINGPQPPPHFMGPGFQFTSQLYTAHPQLHDTDPSNFAIADPSFMMFYGGRMGSGLSSTEDQQINGNGSTEMMMMPPPSSTRSAQQQQQQTQQQQQQQPQQRQHTERRRIPLPTNTTNRTARTSRGQIMVLKDSGDMIAEPDDEANDSGYRHSVPRRYMCSVCSKRFTRPSTLRTHMNSHTGERPYHCPSKGCEWKFTVLSNLKRHMRICTGLKRGSDDLVGATIHEVCELEGATDGDWKP